MSESPMRDLGAVTAARPLLLPPPCTSTRVCGWSCWYSCAAAVTSGWSAVEPTASTCCGCSLLVLVVAQPLRIPSASSTASATRPRRTFFHTETPGKNACLLVPVRAAARAQASPCALIIHLQPLPPKRLTRCLPSEQSAACKQHAGAARWAYNWGLARKQDAYRTTGKRPSAIDLHRELNALKQTDVPWMYAVSKCAPQEALRNLDRAFDGFFRRVKLKKVGQYRGNLGFPTCKTKKRGLGGFRLTGTILVSPDAVHLPRLGRLRLKERGHLPPCASPVRSRIPP